MKLLLETNNDYYAVFKNFYKSYKDIQKVEISKNIVLTYDTPMFKEFHLNGKLLKATKKENDIYAFIDIYGKIILYLTKPNVYELNIEMEEYIPAMRMQIAEEEYMCECGNKFYGKKLKCNFCGKNLIYWH